jgi:hypothetical protein
VKKVVVAYVKAGLRRMWGRSRQRQAALKSARVSRGMYRCSHCDVVFRRKLIQVDHIVSVGKFISFDLFIEKLFCDSKGLAVLCIACHKLKTQKDRKNWK